MTATPVTISTDFPGANIRVRSISGASVKLEQDLRDSTEWWFWWAFRAGSDRPGPCTFEFVNGDVIGPFGPLFSTDGVLWNWLGRESLTNRSSFTYHFRAGQPRVWFAFSFPYTTADLDRFLAQVGRSPNVGRGVLARSEGGRDIPLLTLGNPRSHRHLVFTCRHHACESTASYALEGLLRHFIEQPHAPLLRSACIHAVPFVDIDGVEKGDQGKRRAPHDHNRDYTARPRYAAVRAIMDLVNGLRGTLVAVIDFHSPGKWGGRNDQPFLAEANPDSREETIRFNDTLAEVCAGGLVPDPFAIQHGRTSYIKSGVEWNTVTGDTFTDFVAQRRPQLHTTLEFPYFGVGRPVYTADLMREYGRHVGVALERFLEHR